MTKRIIFPTRDDDNANGKQKRNLVAIASSSILKIDFKIRRGPKLEGYAFANFGYSSETDGESQNPHITASGDTSLKEEKIGLVSMEV